MKEEVKAVESSKPAKPQYYVEFNVKQQRNFENCIIENQTVVTPERLICLSDIRIKDMRKFVYYQVLDKFSQLHPNNIELAYRVKKTDQVSNEVERVYVSLGGMGNLTIDDLMEREIW